MKEAPYTIMVGSTLKHLGKTALICRMISLLKDAYRIAVVKVTPGRQAGFSLTEETSTDPLTDTARILAAGADHVYHLTADRESMCPAIESLREEEAVSSADVLVLETTSGRACLEPDLFVILDGESEKKKASAAAYLPLADYVITMDDSIRFSEVITCESGRIRILQGLSSEE